jgi:hypothetical protein
MALVVEFFDPDMAAEGTDETIVVDFVSLVSDQTWGPPALVAPNPKNPGAKRATPGERVLYINPSKVAAFAITEQ